MLSGDENVPNEASTHRALKLTSPAAARDCCPVKPRSVCVIPGVRRGWPKERKLKHSARLNDWPTEPPETAFRDLGGHSVRRHQIELWSRSPRLEAC